MLMRSTCCRPVQSGRQDTGELSSKDECMVEVMAMDVVGISPSLSATTVLIMDICL